MTRKRRTTGDRRTEGGEVAARKKKRKDGVSQRPHDPSSAKSIAAQYAVFAKTDTAELTSFEKFPLSTATQRGLAEHEFCAPTDIQRESLIYTLTGVDVVGAAKTGQGKTLAFLIPLLECLFRNQWSRACDGLGAVIISPTRELAFQTFAVLNNIGKHHHLSAALLIGGRDVQYEWRRLGGVNIIVCTPGRLLQHMDENPMFSCDGLKMLVIDEADRLLDAGFMPQMSAILENLPTERQTLLFSATMSKDVKELSRLALQNPVYISVNENAPQPTPENLQQIYFVCRDEDKINLLWSFLVKHRHEKTLIFVSCCKQARFLTEALCHLRPGLSLTGLWGTLKQTKRLEVFEKFNHKTTGAAVIATDVASRGLDFERVDWVFQLDCPATVNDYIHRVGRTARMDAKGRGALVLTPGQKDGMLQLLQARGIPITFQKIKEKDMFDITRKLQSTMAQFSNLKEFAQQSFVAFVRSIHLMPHKDIFDVSSINIEALAKSYGLAVVPRLRFLSRTNQKVSRQAPAKSLAADEHTMSESDAERKSNDDEFGVGTTGRVADGGLPKLELSDSDDDGGELLKLAHEDIFHMRSADAENESEEVTDGEKNSELSLRGAAKLLKKARKGRLSGGGLLKAKKIFTDDDDEVVKSKTGNAQEEKDEGIFDLEEAKREMAIADKEDRIAYKEKQRKWRKEKKEKLKKGRQAKQRAAKDEDELDMGDDENDSVDLSWLPDPDKPKRYDANWNEVETTEQGPSGNGPDEKKAPDAIARRKRQRMIRKDELKALQILDVS